MPKINAFHRHENQKETKNTAWFLDEKLMKEMKAINKHLDKSMTLSMPGKGYKVIYSISLSGLHVEIYQSSEYVMYQAYSGNRKLWKVHAGHMSKRFEYWLPYDGAIYYKNQTDKWIPLTLKSMSFHMLNNPVSELIFQEYMERQIKERRFIWKDLQKHIPNADNTYIPPIAINEVNQYHSIDEMMRTHYKYADFVNWNKADLIWCFSLMKQLNEFDEPTKNLLLSMKYNKEQSSLNKYLF